MPRYTVLDHMNLADSYRTFHPKEAEHTFFLSARGTFSSIDHMLGHKRSLNKFKKIGFRSSSFSNHNGMKSEISYKKETGKFTNVSRLNSMALKNQWVKEEITNKIKKYLETNENGNTTYQNLRDAAKAVLRGKFIAINAYIKKKERSPINNLTL